MALFFSSLLINVLCQGPLIPEEIFSNSTDYCSVSVNFTTVLFFGLGVSGKDIYSFDMKRNLWKFLKTLPSVYNPVEKCAGAAYFSKGYKLYV